MVETSLDFPIYSIKAVSHISGVTEPTLRAWEKRYSVLTPKRTDSGHRRYTKRDIYRVIWLRQRLEEGMSISQASTLLQTQSDETLLEMAQHEAKANRNGNGRTLNGTNGTAKNSRNEDLVRSTPQLSDELLQSFLDYDEQRADHLLEEASGLYSPEQVCLNIIQPVLIEVGERWLRNELTVATEHFATSVCRNRINAMIESLPIIEGGPLILMACAPHEYHELGVVITSFFLRRHGWKVIYLGQNVPALDLDKDLRRLKPDLVCFSATRTESVMFLVRQVSPLLDKLRAEVLPNLIAAYAGRIFQDEPGLHDLFKGWTYFGDDARQSVHLLEHLYSSNR